MKREAPGNITTCHPPQAGHHRRNPPIGVGTRRTVVFEVAIEREPSRRSMGKSRVDVRSSGVKVKGAVNTHHTRKGQGTNASDRAGRTIGPPKDVKKAYVTLRTRGNTH